MREEESIAPAQTEIESSGPTRSRHARDRMQHAIAEAATELRAAAIALTGNAHDADDLIQDTVVRALRFAQGFEAGTSLRAWMRTILRNTAMNRFRDERRRPRSAGSDDAERLFAEIPARAEGAAHVGPEDFERELDRIGHPLHDAVLSLPEGYRSVFLLSSLGDCSYSEIAERLGIPIGTVMSRLHRARKTLRERLELARG